MDRCSPCDNTCHLNGVLRNRTNSLISVRTECVVHRVHRTNRASGYGRSLGRSLGAHLHETGLLGHRSRRGCSFALFGARDYLGRDVLEGVLRVGLLSLVKSGSSSRFMESPA